MHWDALLLAVGDGQRIRGVTTAAGQARLRAGMTVSEARSRCAGLRIQPWDDVAIAEGVRRVTAALLAASPQVTPVAGAPGTWWVGASGFDALGGEVALARTLRDIARRWHPEARVAIADSCVAARAATWDMRREARGGADHPGTPVIVPPGGCAAYLAQTPLGLLPMDDEFRATLIALGIRTAGPLAALAAEDVERRWGSAGLRAWRLASGDDPRRPVLAHPEAPRSVSAEFSPSVTGMEPVLFLVRAALDRLVRELVADGRAAAIVAITLTLDDARGAIPGNGRAHTVTREIRLACPLARVVPLLERCRALLERWELTAPICAVGVAVPASAPLTGEQGELLDPAWRDPAAADAAFARLRAELGPDAIVRPVARDEHRPERAGGWVGVGMEGDAGESGTGRVTGSAAAAVVPPISHGQGNGDGGAGYVDRRAGRHQPQSPEPSSALGSTGIGPPPRFYDTPSPPLLPHHSIADPSMAMPARRPDHRLPSHRESSPPAATAHPAIDAPAPPVSRLTGVIVAGDAMEQTIRDGILPPASQPLRVAPREHRDAGLGHASWTLPVALRLAAEPAPASPPPFELSAAFRHLESPEPITVECAGERPRALWWRGRHLPVRRAIGPERLAGDWWKDPFARDYWRCDHGESAARLLIYREHSPATNTDDWYVQGWYD